MASAAINYLELPASNVEKIKAFYGRVFNWQFTDYGQEYTAFSKDSAGIDGGFYHAPLTCNSEQGSALVVLFSDDLAAIEQEIINAGGSINKPVFSFPGGRRFHFCDPCGNELAVWSDK